MIPLRWPVDVSQESVYIYLYPVHSLLGERLE